ncbi:Uncharacterised protein [Mycobacteroides abscessus subsp. massiliense]|nr:Uncharacterised protein [Mycobacteroides abscessus subsp. massiliense]
MCFACFFNGFPELFEVVQVPFQLFRAAADAGSTGNDAHAVWNVEFRHGGLRDTPPPRGLFGINTK